MDSCTIVIFGASGDLTKRMLIPALFTLYKIKKLPEKFAILGVSRTVFSDTLYREKLTSDLSSKNFDQQELAEFLSHVYYQNIDTAQSADYKLIPTKLATIKQEQQVGDNILFYLSTPPVLYSTIVGDLVAVGLGEQKNCWRRFIIEKPFGYDLKTAQVLNEQLHGFLAEEQIYRIDHYLGKETVQNFLVFRFANSIFESSWNNKHIDYIEITSAESIGVENRGGYYDNAGAMRDMLQNHLLQTLAMVAMEPPTAMNASLMRDEITKVIQHLRPLSEEDLNTNLVLGQYLSSHIGGEQVLGYQEEKGVAENSRTETFLALKLNIDNERWQGVPFYLRIGKRLPARVAEITVHFKNTEYQLFKNAQHNTITLRIQPDEGILLGFSLKEPGSGFDTKKVSMDFHYDELEGVELLTAYERLLLDALNGDATLFTRSDTIEACWQFVQPIIDYKNNSPKVYGYAAGTWGPKEVTEMVERDGRTWRSPCKNLTAEEFCEL